MRDFWIGQPLFSAVENCFFNQAPAFRSIANKRMAILLKRVNFTEEGHGIRPRSLKVTAISSLMDEIVKGKGNLAQLSAQGNYRAVTASDMGEIYSRNIDQQQLHVSKFAQKSVHENQNTEPALAVEKVPDFAESKIRKNKRERS